MMSADCLVLLSDVDLPTAEQRRAIWDIYLRLFDLDPQAGMGGLELSDQRLDPGHVPELPETQGGLLFFLS